MILGWDMGVRVVLASWSIFSVLLSTILPITHYTDRLSRYSQVFYLVPLSQEEGSHIHNFVTLVTSAWGILCKHGQALTILLPLAAR